MCRFRACVAVNIFILLFLFCTSGYGQFVIDTNEQQQLLELAIKTKDYSKAAGHAFLLGRYYQEVKQPSQAAEYFSNCISYSKKANQKLQMQQAYHQLGLLHQAAKDYGKAVGQFEKSVKLARSMQETALVMDGLLGVATSLGHQNRYKKAIAPLEEALSLALQQQNAAIQERCYGLLSAYYRQLGDQKKEAEYKALLNNLVKGNELEVLSQKVQHFSAEKNTVQAKLQQETSRLAQTKDSLLQAKSSLQETHHSLQKATEINEKRQLQIDLLGKEKALAELHIKEQQARLAFETWIRNTVIGGLLLAAAFMVVVVKNYRSQKIANGKIEKQNHNIKSSINYARRIQEAMLPSQALQQKVLPASFIVFKPKDTVSGDFYYFDAIQDKDGAQVVFAAADCTGHGVPGAFMSLIGINALHGIISRGIVEANQILDALDTEIRANLQQEISGNHDGMDIALCVYRKEAAVVEYSGAKNPLVYIQDGELFQLKGDVHPIGGHKRKKEFSFKKHLIAVNKPTMLYLFSDGFRDQFGDNNAGKFMSKKFNQLLLDIHRLPLAEQKELLSKTFEDWKGQQPQIDDVLVMGICLDANL